MTTETVQLEVPELFDECLEAAIRGEKRWWQCATIERASEYVDRVFAHQAKCCGGEACPGRRISYRYPSGGVLYITVVNP